MTMTPRTIGPWTLLEELGKGGNATVWSARRSGEPEPIALKVIDAIRPERERYKRFVAEIEFLRGLENSDGVLALTDAHLPASPSRADRPWLAMPIATPNATAIEESSLETVVAAV
ncbi:MAG: hypothetical protein JWN81_7, partial [Solirubrobacterales bacterium]|nr:hypothetical protein [Solirubrobacterales bacterium]